jgi:hypothetical protein
MTTRRQRNTLKEVERAGSLRGSAPAWSRDDDEAAMSPVLEKPPAISCDLDAASVESTTGPTGHSSSRSCYAWGRPHVSLPVIDSFTILTLGAFLCGLALVWPPLLLFAAYAASKLVSYAFRDNDDATARRQMYAQFCQESDELPERFRNIDQYVELTESFWTNERYVLIRRRSAQVRNSRDHAAMI